MRLEYQPVLPILVSQASQFVASTPRNAPEVVSWR